MLEVNKISVGYGKREVIAGLSLEVGDGEVIAVIGPNGAGKTTFVNALNGSVRLTHGEIKLGDRSIDSMSRREIAREIAVVAQETETRFPITVTEFVLAGRFIHGGVFGWETGSDTKAAERALADCDLSGFADRQMNELSGGERQRVVLARALATNARILLLDEPTANLDLAHQAMMFRLVSERCRSCGGSAVVITHDLNLASNFADRLLLLDAGRAVAIGSATEVLTAENISDVFGVNVMLDTNPANGSVRVTNVY